MDKAHQNHYDYLSALPAAQMGVRLKLQQQPSRMPDRQQQQSSGFSEFQPRWQHQGEVQGRLGKPSSRQR